MRATPACIKHWLLRRRHTSLLGLWGQSLGLQLLYHPGLFSYLGAQVLHLHGWTFKHQK